MKKAGRGQLDMILDGIVDDPDTAVEYDRLIGVEVVHKCEICQHKISADESRAFGIGYDCAADLGRRVWAAQRAERRAAEVRGTLDPAVDEGPDS
jgi:hypothetical protein